jgi:PilZ domain
MSPNASALVQPIPQGGLEAFERRSSVRHAVTLEALSRPLDAQDAIWWGATVRNLSNSGLALSVCFPFRPGTYLAVDLQGPSGGNHTFLTRVIYARDQVDGTWQVGCEFINRLTDSDMEIII